MSIAESLDEFCTSCGEWVSMLMFDYETGWCVGCSRSDDSQPRCSRCGGVLEPSHGRTTCHSCRQELWLLAHGDDLEFLIVVKGYSVSYAREVIVKMTRPICQWCRRPIKGAHSGAMFHKGNNYKACRSASLKFKRLLNKGLTIEEALATLRE